jgi:hypothetical protein
VPQSIPPHYARIVRNPVKRYIMDRLFSWLRSVINIP